MNERVADALHRHVVEELASGWIKPIARDQLLAGYTKKVLDHLVLLEEEVNDLHHRNAQLSRRLRALQGRLDRQRRK